MPRSTSRPEPPQWAPFVAGGSGGAIASLATCPLEVVKTRLQAAHNKRELRRAALQAPRGLQTFSALREIYVRDGVKGLWRGAVPQVSAVMVMRGAHFWMYHSMRDFLDDRRRSRKFEELRASAGPGASMRRQDIELEDSTLVALASSVTAGFVVHTLTSPIWVVKTRLQLQSGDRLLYSGVRDCMVKLYEREGARGFYKGLSASYMGLSETGAQFAMYERMKRVLQNYRFRSQPAGGPARNPGDIDLNPHEYFAVASCAKLLASVVTYPHEVVRTRLREQSSDRRYRGFFHTLGTIAREEGRVGLYGGMGAHLLRVVPNAALLFVTYEAVLKLLTPPAADTSRS